MYRWDDRALVSFYPVGKLSGRAGQLEVTVDSPLGSFISNRFQAVWHAAASYQALTPVTVSDGNIERTYLVRFVDLVDGRDCCTRPSTGSRGRSPTPLSPAANVGSIGRRRRVAS